MKKQITLIMTILVVMVLNTFVFDDKEGNGDVNGLLTSLALIPIALYFLYSCAIELIGDEPVFAIMFYVLLAIIFTVGSSGVLDIVLMRHAISSKLLSIGPPILLHGIAIYYGVQASRKRAVDADRQFSID